MVEKLFTVVIAAGLACSFVLFVKGRLTAVLVGILIAAAVSSIALGFSVDPKYLSFCLLFLALAIKVPEWLPSLDGKPRNEKTTQD